MKKLLVLVVAILALAGLATMAHADTVIFQDSWAYAFATWQGSNQDTYGTDPSGHAISEASILSTFLGETGNFVSQITYDQSKESWSGHLTAAAGVNLSGVVRLSFKVRSDDTMPVAVKINKVVVNDANNNALTIKAGFDAPLSTWSTIQSDAGTFDGRNMAAVTMPFGFYMSASDNPGITGNCIFYFDDVKYVGGGTGTVRVTLTSGVVGVQIERSVNFDLILGGITTNFSYNSADIGDDQQNHFVVTNKGTDPCYYRVRLINPGGWTAVNPTLPANTLSLTATDTYALYGQFADQSANLAGNMASYAAVDGITTTAKAAAAGVLDYSGLGDGYNVAASAARNLWIALHTPPLTSVGSTQQITVVISAVKL